MQTLPETTLAAIGRMTVVFDDVARRLVGCRDLLHTAVGTGVGVTLR